MESDVLLRHAHLSLVALSLLGFAARAAGVLAGAARAMRGGLRRAVLVVDTLLLAAGLGLWSLLGWAAMPWLFAKFGRLLAYILLGCAAQLLATAASLHPLGLFAP